jgi:hypothetical protein
MEPDRGRSRRIAPAAVAFALFVGAVWLVTSGGPFGPAPTPTPIESSTPTGSPVLIEPTEPNLSARVGFLGLPPVGAAPSRPRSGRLVLG